MSVQQDLVKYETQEKELVFQAFTNEDGKAIGEAIIDKVKTMGRAVVVDIVRNRQRIYYHAMEGTHIDFERRAVKKARIVQDYFMSSIKLCKFLEMNGKTMEEMLQLSSQEYSARGGSFPIHVKGSGIIGTITVSGMDHEEDHQVIVDVLEAYLN